MDAQSRAMKGPDLQCCCCESPREDFFSGSTLARDQECHVIVKDAMDQAEDFFIAELSAMIPLPVVPASSLR